MEGEEAYVVLNLRRRNQSALPHPQGSQDSPLNLRWYKIILGLLLAGSVALKLGVAILVLSGFRSGSQKEQSRVATTAAENTSAAGGDVNGEEHSRDMMNSKSPCEAMPQISSTEDCWCKLCPADWLLHKNKCYWVSKESKSWRESHEDCSAKSSEMLVIQDKEEMGYILNITHMNNVWLGLNVTSPERKWTWVDGSMLDETLFQLTGDRKMDSCGMIKKNHTISEICSDVAKWICEKVALK